MIEKRCRSNFRSSSLTKTSPGLLVIPQSLSVASAVEELLLICDRDRRMGQPHLHLATVRSVMSNATKEAHATIAEARICERPSGRRGKCGNL